MGKIRRLEVVRLAVVAVGELHELGVRPHLGLWADVRVRIRPRPVRRTTLPSLRTIMRSARVAMWTRWVISVRFFDPLEPMVKEANAHRIVDWFRRSVTSFSNLCSQMMHEG
jgi:hypothetical protein